MKKFLSLVLALVMTMSLVTVSAGAKDFSDNSKIAYKEAVDVMSAVKVIDGYTDGSFNPSATLTRGAAAKIICNLILGPTTAGALVADAAPYKDVPTNHTFAGYIAYCQKEGIISGYADGTFKPANTLTGYAFMKMLLGALGYDAEVEGYTGPNWSINVAKRAVNIGLNDDLVGDFNGVKAVTREEACLYALNTMKADMVEYDAKTTVSTNGTTVVIAGSKAKEMVNNGTTDGKVFTKDGVMQFAEKYFTDLTVKTGSDDFSRPANVWKLKAEEIGTYAKTPDVAYTKDVKAGTVYSDLGLGKKVTAESISLFVNGTEKTSKVDIAKGSSTKIGDDTGAVGNGVLTEVFYNADDNTAIVTQIVTYYGEVAKTVKATSTKDTYIVIDPDGTEKPDNFKANFETDEKFEDDAVVYYTFSETAKEIKSVGLAQVVSGVVTEAQNKKVESLDSKNVTIGGTQYKASYAFIGDEVSSNMVKGEYDVYLDGNGYMIKIEEVGTLSSNYAFVLELSAYHTSVFNGKQAQLLFADGTVKTVPTAKDYMTYDGKDLTNKIVTYREEDGVYTLKRVEANGADATVTAEGMDGTSSKDFTLKTDKATIGVKGAVVTSNSASQFVTYDKADDEAAAYTGTKNSPSITATGAANGKVDAYYYCKNNKMVTVMFILCDDAIISGATNKTIFFARESRSNLISDKTGTYFKYNAVVNGEMMTVMVEDTCSGGDASDLNGLYKSYTLNSKGVITGLTAYTGSELFASDKGENGSYLKGDGIAKTSKDYTVTLDTKNVLDANGKVRSSYEDYVITVDKDAAIYAVDEDGNITESTYRAIAQDANDKVFAYVDDYLVKSLYIQEIDDDETDAPEINVANYDVSYGAAGAVTVKYHKDAKHDDNTLLDVILATLKADGYTKFDVSSDGASPAQYTIKATKGYINTTFTFKNNAAGAIESVKIKLDGKSMLAATGSTLADNGAKGVWAKVTKADGTSDGIKATTTTVTEGYAYESGYYKVAKNAVKVGGSGTDVALFQANALSDDAYVKAGGTVTFELQVITNATTKDSKITFTDADGIVAETITVAKDTAKDTKISVTLTLAAEGTVGDIAANGIDATVADA